MVQSLVFGIILFAFVFHSFSSPAVTIHDEWFLSIQYEPTDKQIEGIPLDQLDPNWSEVLVLTKENFLSPTSPMRDDVMRDDVTSMGKYGYDFYREGDFNNDKVKDKVLVGVYQDKLTKAKGRFLLILTKNAQNLWRKAYLVKDPGTAGFSVLSGDGDFVYWAYCIGCDVFYMLIWKHGRYNLEFMGPD